VIKRSFQISIISLVLAGCASSSNVYEMQPGVFTVTATGDGYTTADRVMDLAMGKAQQACASQGRRLSVVNQNQSRTRMGIDTTIALSFRCV
jgi:hypothetical protein